MTTTTATLDIITPQPPEWLIRTTKDLFAPAPEVRDFVQEYFLNEQSELFNEDHSHLRYAEIGYLWTNQTCEQKQKRVAGMAALPTIQGNKWMKGIFNRQLESWFGDWFSGDELNLDFIIILDAMLVSEYRPLQFCGLVDHELYHCAQKRDRYGELMFDEETGLPRLALQGHDVEEFVGIMRRYGIEACAGQTREFIEASQRKPIFSDEDIREIVCGNCLALKA